MEWLRSWVENSPFIHWLRRSVVIGFFEDVLFFGSLLAVIHSHHTQKFDLFFRESRFRDKGTYKFHIKWDVLVKGVISYVGLSNVGRNMSLFLWPPWIDEALCYPLTTYSSLPCVIFHDILSHNGFDYGDLVDLLVVVSFYRWTSCNTSGT